MKEYIHPWTVDITKTIAGAFIRFAVAVNYFKFEIKGLFERLFNRDV